MKLDAVNTYSVRFEVLRDNAVYSEIFAIDHSAEVQFIESSELKTSLRGQFFDYSDDINFLTDRLRPVVVINDVEYPVGVYAITTESEHCGNGVANKNLEGYSLLYLAQRKRIEERLSIPAGTNYMAVILDLLVSCGLTSIEADETDLTFAAAREDWNIGTPILEIVNELLAEINYNAAWVDLNGIVRLTKYIRPSLETIKHTYSAGEYSMIESTCVRKSDRFGKYNVFRVVCESPDLEEPMVAVSENNAEGSPFAISQLGRILYSEQIDSTPSQAALQAYADRLRDQSLQETEEVEFYTAPVPEHNAFETVALNNGNLTGIYIETEWRLQLSPGVSMYHKARRVYAG